MRVLQLCHAPQRRGAEIFAARLAGRLRRAGHAVGTLYLYPHRGSSALPLEEGDEVLDGREGHPAERLAGVHPGLLRRLAGAIRRFAPDLVQANGGATVKYAAAARRRDAGGGWALVYRNIGHPGDWQRGAVRRLYYRLLVMPAADAVAAVSRRALDELAALHGLRVPAAVLPTAIDPETLVPRRSRAEVRRETATPAAAPVVIQAGSLTPEKRPGHLLAAFRTVRRELPEARLWLLGDGPLRPGLERQCRGELAAAVRFLGARDDAASHLAAADVLALASDTEGVPAVVLEAGWLGLPAVATRVGGLAECVADGETGLLVEPGDETGLARALIELLADGERRRRLGEAARRRVAAGFTLDAVAPGFEALYAEALSVRRGGGR